MMDFGIGGIASGVFGFLGAMENAEAQREATQANWAINIANMQARERERNEAIAMSNKLRGEQKLGTTDIRGTRTKFVPGQGWVVTGSPELLELMKLQDAEQRKVLTQDLPMRRNVMQRNYTRGLEEEALADTFKRQLMNKAPGSDDAYAADLYQAMAGGLREASGDAGRRVFTQAMRTGQNSNFGDIATGLQRADNSAYANAALQAKLMAEGHADKKAGERQNRLANLYNLFATRAQQLPETNYKPMSIDEKGTVSDATKQAMAAGELSTKMSAMKGGELDYIPANMGYGNAISALGGAFSGIGGGGSRSRQQPQQQQSFGVQGFGATGGGSGYDDMYIGSQHDLGGW